MRRLDAVSGAVGDLMSAHSARWLRIAAVLLLLLAALRMASIVLAEPMVGFANQYDMHRTSACIGIWPEDVPIAQATPEAPRAAYRMQAPMEPACYRSSQVAIALIALGVDRVFDRFLGTDPERISLRAVGAIGVLLWLFGAFCVARMLWAHAGLLFGHGLVSALLIADPINTLYLNTLYTEFPALLGMYFASAIVVSLWVSAAAPRARLIGLMLCLLLLGFSRVQHLALPFLLALFATLAFWLARLSLWRPTLWLLSGCLLVVVAQSLQQSRFEGIARANIADTVLGAAMPAGDPEAIGQALGLPEQCAELAYSTWYRQHGVDVFAQCPELAKVSRLRLLGVSLGQPSMLARMLLRGLLMSQNLRLGYLGERAGGDYAHIDKRDSRLWGSVAAWFNALPARLFIWLACALLAAIPMFWVALIRSRRDGVEQWQSDSVLIVLCAHLLALTLLSSVFGDGYSEVARHLHLGLNALLIALGLLPIWVLRRLSMRRWSGRAILPMLAGVTWLLITTFAVMRLPLAFGVLGSPAEVLPTSGAIELRGWALDARPLRRMFVRVDGREVLALQRLPHPRLDQVFPYLAEAANGGFGGTLDATTLMGSRFLDIVAVDASGSEVLIERRLIR